MSDTNDDAGTSDERVRYGHALRVLAVLLRTDANPHVVAVRIEQLADDISEQEEGGVA